MHSTRKDSSMQSFSSRSENVTFNPRQVKHKKALMTLDYKAALADKIIIRKGYEDTYKKIVTLHFYLITLYTHEEIIKIADCKDGGSNLAGIKNHFSALRHLKYTKEDIHNIVSKVGGANNLADVETYHTSLCDLGFTPKDIIKMVGYNDAVSNLNVLMQCMNFRTTFSLESRIRLDEMVLRLQKGKMGIQELMYYVKQECEKVLSELNLNPSHAELHDLLALHLDILTSSVLTPSGQHVPTLIELSGLGTELLALGKHVQCELDARDKLVLVSGKRKRADSPAQNLYAELQKILSSQNLKGSKNEQTVTISSECKVNLTTQFDKAMLVNAGIFLWKANAENPYRLTINWNKYKAWLLANPFSDPVLLQKKKMLTSTASLNCTLNFLNSTIHVNLAKSDFITLPWVKVTDSTTSMKELSLFLDRVDAAEVERSAIPFPEIHPEKNGPAQSLFKF